MLQILRELKVYLVQRIYLVLNLVIVIFTRPVDNLDHDAIDLIKPQALHFKLAEF